MKGAIHDLISLYFTLQIICYLSIYDTPLPSNTEIYMQEFTNLIEFKALKPDSIVKVINPEFNLMEWVTQKKAKIVSKDQTASIINDMQFYIMAAFIVILIMTAMIIPIVFGG